MPVPRPGPLVAAALLALTALGAAGCSSDDGSATATPTASASATAGSSAAATDAAGSSAAATEVDVSATEFAFSLSQEQFSPGDYTFVMSDDGSAPHAMTITGPGVDASSDRVGPGGTVQLTVTLQAGEYELLCPVGNHADQGMRMTISVG